MNAQPLHEVDQHNAEDKLKELILYVAARSADDANFGATKLNKLLFYCDFRAVQEFGEPITGVEYVHREAGPAPRRLLPVRRSMEEENEILLWEKPLPGQYNPQERVVPRRKANLDLFSSKEIALIESVIQECWDKTGTQLSNETHDGVGWLLTNEGETMPYETALIQSVKVLDLDNGTSSAPDRNHIPQRLRDYASELHPGRP